jgi:hypothetical protein
MEIQNAVVTLEKKVWQFLIKLINSLLNLWLRNATLNVFIQENESLSPQKYLHVSDQSSLRSRLKFEVTQISISI